jgi:hypothetical protein
MSRTRKKLIQFLSYSTSFLIITVAYNNCGNFGSNNGGEVISSTSDSMNGDIVPLPNTKTASVIRASRVLDNLVSCLGTVQPSTNAQREWERNRGTISEEGLANTVSQPMVKSMISIAAEVCNDLVQSERNIPADERRIFTDIDMNNGGVGHTQLSQVTKKLARSCWGRNPTSDETNQITLDIARSFIEDNDNGQTTRNKLIYLCTAMASSFATYEM